MMLSRRAFLKAAAACAFLPSACVPQGYSSQGTLLNDIHSKLNPTRVRRVIRPRKTEEVADAIRSARQQGRAISIAGGRHAMGGQQFANDAIHLDMTSLDDVFEFDAEKGEVEVGSGIMWPALIAHLHRIQKGRAAQWGIVQKQTGADRLTVGGALAANAHGRGLTWPPFVSHVRAFTILTADGKEMRCSRSENPELFRAAIGGYGLMGVVTSIRLRLGRREKLERVVEVRDSSGLIDAFESRIADGYLYGDFQFSTDRDSKDFVKKGVFSCYRPVSDDVKIDDGQVGLSKEAWQKLILLGHVDRMRAFEVYSDHYLRSNGQIYWSDTHETADYIDDYHSWIDRKTSALYPGSEMITEIYVPRRSLEDFLIDVRHDFRQRDVELIYGTIRMIERDEETLLAWARERWACIVFNLHVDHVTSGIERSSADFQRLIDRAIQYGGSYYLTYHRWASQEQVMKCHPRMREFLEAKRRLDPDELFQSEWYRHHRSLMAV